MNGNGYLGFIYELSAQTQWDRDEASCHGTRVEKLYVDLHAFEANYKKNKSRLTRGRWVTLFARGKSMSQHRIFCHIIRVRSTVNYPPTVTQSVTYYNYFQEKKNQIDFLN